MTGSQNASGRLVAGEQQRHAGHTTIDEPARQQKSLQAKAGGEDAQEDQNGVEKLSRHQIC